MKFIILLNNYKIKLNLTQISKFTYGKRQSELVMQIIMRGCGTSLLYCHPRTSYNS